MTTCHWASRADSPPGRRTEAQMVRASRRWAWAWSGHAFMGAAHSQAWRTAGRVFDLPLAPVMAALCGRDRDRTAAAAAAAGLGRGGDRLEGAGAPGGRRRSSTSAPRGTATPKSPSRPWRRASTSCARSHWPTPSKRPVAMTAAAERARAPGRTSDGGLQLPPGARPRVGPPADRRRPARGDPPRPRGLSAGLARRPRPSRWRGGWTRNEPGPAPSATSAPTSSTSRNSSRVSGSRASVR